MPRLNKSHFNAGSPYSSWLKEELIGEIGDHKAGLKNRGLVKKYKVEIFDGIEEAILHSVKEFDDYPESIKAMATEIIRTELDKSFKP